MPFNKQYDFIGFKPYRWQYSYYALAHDKDGNMSDFWVGISSPTWLANTAPYNPTLTSTQTTIQLGQSVTISSFNGTDINANVMDSWLWRSEEHTSELQSPYVISYAV